MLYGARGDYLGVSSASASGSAGSDNLALTAPIYTSASLHTRTSHHTAGLLLLVFPLSSSLPLHT